MSIKNQISRIRYQIRIFYLFVFICLLVYLFIGLFVGRTQAQSFSISINPPIIQIEAEPPTTISTPINLENKSDQNITYNIYLRPFKAGFELNGIPYYDPELNSEYKDFFKNVQIKDGDRDITQVKLSPKENKELNLQIRIESDGQTQDRYFTIVFLAVPNNLKTENSLTEARAGIGTNILLSVAPKAEAEGRIAKFKTPLFITHGPVPFELELANHSNSYITSEGTVIIKNMFGQIVGALEFGPLNILAKSNRLASNESGSENKLWWNEKYPIGIYKVQANIALSERGPLITEELIFIAFPLQLAFIFIFALLILIWLLKRARKKATEEN